MLPQWLFGKACTKKEHKVIKNTCLTAFLKNYLTLKKIAAN